MASRRGNARETAPTGEIARRFFRPNVLSVKLSVRSASKKTTPRLSAKISDIKAKKAVRESKRKNVRLPRNVSTV